MWVEDSFTKEMLIEKGVKPGEARKCELRDPVRRCINQLMMETVSLHTLRWTLKRRGEEAWSTPSSWDLALHPSNPSNMFNYKYLKCVWQKTKASAAAARDSGITMFAVGVGDGISQSELEDIAATPSQVCLAGGGGNQKIPPQRGDRRYRGDRPPPILTLRQHALKRQWMSR